MYNAFVHKQQVEKQESQKLKSASLQKFVDCYYSKKRPQLLNNYNKRINQFIRKVQNDPIVLKQNPYQTGPEQRRHSTLETTYDQHYSRHKNSQKSVSNMHTIDGVHEHSETFKFKNTEDWTSLFTPWERLERKRNYDIFKTKYGDPNIAFRSIGSQSEYHPYHDFRDRNQNMEINPPMRYTSKPTQQVLAKMKSKYAKKEQELKLKNNNKSHDLKESKSMNIANMMINSSAMSVSGIGEQMLTNENDNSHSSEEPKNEDQQNNEKRIKTSKNLKNRIYFKEVMDIEQNVKDVGTKKLLRNVLYKCGVYRKKNKRVNTQAEQDQFSQFQRAEASP